MTNVSNIQILFFELIQVSIGICKTFSRIPFREEWLVLYTLSEKQLLASASMDFGGFTKNSSGFVLICPSS